MFNHYINTSDIAYLPVYKRKRCLHLGFHELWVSAAGQQAVQYGHLLPVRPGVPQEL